MNRSTFCFLNRRETLVVVNTVLLVISVGSAWAEEQEEPVRT